MRFVDSHCHLDFEDFGAERQAVIERARAAGVQTMVSICTKLSELPDILALAESDPDIWCTVGTHPHEAETDDALDPAGWLAHAQHPKVIGIGEAGLDYYYDHSPRERQAEIFRLQAGVARDAGLPLVVHTRDADEDTAQILNEESRGGALTGVLHCFSSGAELARRALEIGFYVSISGIVTFKKAEALREIVRMLPLDRLLIETDAPYLAPIPFRGKRNEPAYVVHTAEAVAALQGISLESLADATTANFHRLFTKAASAR